MVSISVRAAQTGCLVAALAAGDLAHAQCTPRWEPVGQGTNGMVFTQAVLPGGDFVAGGSFDVAGLQPINRIARWNGTSWSALGTGMSGGASPEVLALAVLPGSDLVASGVFTTAGGVAASNIARWNGSTWSALGGGTNGVVWGLAVLPNGNLVAGGDFFTAGGVSANRIARWNGSAWSPLGSGMSPGFPASVRALAVLPNGDLVAGGNFTTAGGVTASNIARWNGSSWSPLGSGMNGPVLALAVLPNSDLVAGGDFFTAGGVSASNIARWNGSSWSPLGLGLSGVVRALAVLPNGDLVAGGNFIFAGGVSANRVARWNGLSWSALGSGTNAFVYTLVVPPNGDLVAGGQFTTPGNRVARWMSALACYANCDCSTGSPALTPADFVCFLNRFRAGEPYANCDGSTGMPALTPADFVCFLNRFRAGC